MNEDPQAESPLGEEPQPELEKEWAEEQETILAPPAAIDDAEIASSEGVGAEFVEELSSDAESDASDVTIPSLPPRFESHSTVPASDWEKELSSQRVAVQLRHIEEQVRAIIDSRDSKRKRKLTGTQRWRELEEDIISWQFSGRFEESQIQRVRELVVQRDHLFNHLRFLASTRPTWNS